MLAGAVPRIYAALCDLDAHEAEVAHTVLSGAACVWVGNGFAAADRVAFR